VDLYDLEVERENVIKTYQLFTVIAQELEEGKAQMEA
jgi:hypothetical protein